MMGTWAWILVAWTASALLKDKKFSISRGRRWWAWFLVGCGRLGAQHLQEAIHLNSRRNKTLIFSSLQRNRGLSTKYIFVVFQFSSGCRPASLCS